MKNNKIILPKCEIEKSPYDLPDPENEKKEKERTKPSVERKKLPSEKKYNELLKKLYKQQKKKDIS